MDDKRFDFYKFSIIETEPFLEMKMVFCLPYISYSSGDLPWIALPYAHLLMGRKPQNWYCYQQNLVFLVLPSYFINPINVFRFLLEFVGEVGAENRVLDDSRFAAYGHYEWTVGRYKAKDGRLNNAFPWGNKGDQINPWFRVDLGRIMLVNGISTQGNPRYGSNYFINYRLEFSLQDSGTAMVYVKQENSSAVKVSFKICILLQAPRLHTGKG